MAIDWDAKVLAPCHDAGVFGESAVFTSKATGTPLPVVGVFFDGYTSSVSLGDSGVGVTTIKPVLAVRAELFGSQIPVKSDQIQVRGDSYIVRDVQPDGLGDLRLELQKAS